MTPASTDALTLSRPEFALLGQLGAGRSLIEEWVEPLDEMSWAVVFDGLLARGVIAWDPTQAADVVTAPWRALVEPVISPLLAVNATASRLDGSVNLNALIGPSSAVEHAPETTGLHRVWLVEQAGLAQRVSTMFGLVGGPPDADGPPTVLALEQLEAAVAAASDRGAEAAAALLPACPGYAYALVDAAGPNVVEVRQLDESHGVLSATLSWIDGGPEHGCWTAVPKDDGVAVRPVRRGDLAAQIHTALESALASPVG